MTSAREQILIDRIKSLEAENDALKAHSEALKSIRNEWITTDMDDDTATNKIMFAVMRSPYQCLAQLRASAIAKAVFVCSVSSFNECGEATCTPESLTDYATSLVTQEKAR